MANVRKESHTNKYYFVGDEKIPLLQARDLKAVRLEGSPERPARHAAVAAKPMRADGGEEIGFAGITVYRTSTTTRTPSGAAAARAPEGQAAQTFPVFRTADTDPESALILTQELIVQFKPNVSETECNKLINEIKLDVVRRDEAVKNLYICKVRSNDPEDALAAANELHQKAQVEYAQPDFVRLMPKILPSNAFGAAPAPIQPPVITSGPAIGAAVSPAPEVSGELMPSPMAPDPFIGAQWGLNKIRARDAWAITRGNPGIRIAVIDEGVDMSHEDMMTNLLTGYDSVDNDNNQQPNPRDGHGTSCAGIIAAVADNGRGVAGVAPNCKVIPIRIAVGTPSGGWATTDSIIARGIRTAVDRGAAVLSNSWGGGSASNVIRSAFQYARTNGRGGKGCFTPCASGNSDTASIIYPAKYPECFAVGAANEWDQRKSKTSADGENWWGSQYGPQLQVVAPGVHVYTTDIMGAAGYNTGGNYVTNFNGTSSATPHVAGVGALVLSVDPNLTVQECEEIIRRTCDDLLSTGHDNQTGFGRVNALRAVQAASRVWHEVGAAIQFLGRGREAFMRLNLRIYNSGINRVQINSILLRSFTADWATEVDRIECVPNPGGIMQPFTGQDIRVRNILLKANGNRSSWSYRWGISYNYTYWRPSLPATALDAAGNLTRQRAEQFDEVATTENVSFRFEGRGHGLAQQLDQSASGSLTELNLPHPENGALTLPVSFIPTNEFGMTESNVNGEPGLSTQLSDSGIVIEKTGNTIRVHL